MWEPVIGLRIDDMHCGVVTRVRIVGRIKRKVLHSWLMRVWHLNEGLRAGLSGNKNENFL